MHMKSFLVIVYILTVTNCICYGSILDGLKKAGCIAVGIGPIGLGAYPAAAGIMAQRAKDRKISGEPLSADYKKALKCHYNPAMLDKIRVYWGVPPLDTWKFLGKNILSGNTAAMTFGYNIYVKAGKLSGIQQLTLIRHECMHTKQYESDGSLAAFGFNYFTQWCMGGFSYNKIKYEINAYATASWPVCK